MKKYFTMSQAAKVCIVDRSTMHRWVNAGKIKSYSTPGGHKRILPQDLKIWLEKNGLPFHIDELNNDKRKILIADDDISIQKYLKKILSGILIELEFASDGFEAGKKLVQFHPDLIILDLFMPGMDGFEVCRRVKEDKATSKTKILIMSGHGKKGNVEKALSLGADDFLEKPSSKKKILNCVEKLLKP